MLMYTKRCLEQYKKICADGLDADVPKERFITRLLDGSGLDKGDQEDVMQNVTQKNNYEEVANALRMKFSQQECSAVEMEHQRQRCVRSTSSLPRRQSSVEKWQEKQFARQGAKVSPEKDPEDAAGEGMGAAKILERDDSFVGDACKDTLVEHELQCRQ